MNKLNNTPVAQQMWDYLLSVGFKKIDNHDIRLGDKTGWEYNIAKGNLCFYEEDLLEHVLFFIDASRDCPWATGCHTRCFDINSVHDLEAWLKCNNYL